MAIVLNYFTYCGLKYGVFIVVLLNLLGGFSGVYFHEKIQNYITAAKPHNVTESVYLIVVEKAMRFWYGCGILSFVNIPLLWIDTNPLKRLVSWLVIYGVIDLFILIFTVTLAMLLTEVVFAVNVLLFGISCCCIQLYFWSIMFKYLQLCIKKHENDNATVIAPAKPPAMLNISILKCVKVEDQKPIMNNETQSTRIPQFTCDNHQ